MTDPTYPEKRIKTRSMPNVEDERLLERLEWIRSHWKKLLKRDTGRNVFADTVREIMNIERELCHRRIPFKPMTNALHLNVPVDEIRSVGPYEGRKKKKN